MTDAEREILADAIDTAVKANKRYLIATIWSLLLSMIIIIETMLLIAR